MNKHEALNIVLAAAMVERKRMAEQEKLARNRIYSLAKRKRADVKELDAALAILREL